MSRVLIIDDNLDNFEILNGREIHGVEFTVVTDELEALKMLNDPKHCCDAVLIDFGMPIMDGFELALQIRLNQSTSLIDPKLKLAFYSGFDIDNDIIRMMGEAKITQYFKKPLDPYTLAIEINEWLSESDLK
jgi:CheY-like chemotaxis protein